MGAGLLSSISLLSVFNERYLYLVLLPLFVFVNGLLISRSVERKGTKHYLWERLTDLCWVYLLWTFLQGGTEVLTSPFKNVPTQWHEVFAIWAPRAQLWYLPYLMVATVLLVLIRPWRGGARLWIGIICGALISYAGWGHDGTTVLTRGMSLMVFIIIGATWGAHRTFRMWDSASNALLLLLGSAGSVAAVFIGFTAASTMPTANLPLGWDPLGIFLGFAGAMAGIIGLSSLVILICRFSDHLKDFFAYLGRHSMAIYLGHITSMAAVRILLARVGIENVTIHILAGTMIGGLACLMIVWLARPMPWLLAAPAWLKPRRSFDPQRTGVQHAAQPTP